jgi:hypothetical protein
VTSYSRVITPLRALCIVVREHDDECLLNDPRIDRLRLLAIGITGSI